MEAIAPYWKAVVAFIAPGAVTLLAALTPESAGGSSIVAEEWITAIITSIITSAGVYSVTNKPRVSQTDTVP